MADTQDTSPASAEPPAEQEAAASAADVAAVTPVVAAAPKRWTRFLTPALALVAALIVGGVAGVLIGQNTASANNASSVRGGFGGGQGFPGLGDRQGGTGTGSGTGTGARGGFTAGTITSIDGGTITLQLADGSTVKVTTSGSTTVTKSSTAQVSDLTTGETITVIGQADASGDVNATRISEGTDGFVGFGRGARPSDAPTPAPTN
jgi:hypothetical protein